LGRYLVEDRYTSGIYEEDLAQKLGLDAMEICRHIDSVLWYVSG